MRRLLPRLKVAIAEAQNPAPSWSSAPHNALAPDVARCVAASQVRYHCDHCAGHVAEAQVCWAAINCEDYFGQMETPNSAPSARATQPLNRSSVSRRALY